jgi:hypothetical protein
MDVIYLSRNLVGQDGDTGGKIGRWMVKLRDGWLRKRDGWHKRKLLG